VVTSKLFLISLILSGLSGRKIGQSIDLSILPMTSSVLDSYCIFRPEGFHSKEENYVSNYIIQRVLIVSQFLNIE